MMPRSDRGRHSLKSQSAPRFFCKSLIPSAPGRPATAPFDMRLAPDHNMISFNTSSTNLTDNYIDNSNLFPTLQSSSAWYIRPAVTYPVRIAIVAAILLLLRGVFNRYGLRGLFRRVSVTSGEQSKSCYLCLRKAPLTGTAIDESCGVALSELAIPPVPAMLDIEAAAATRSD